MHRIPPPAFGPDFDVLDRIDELEDYIEDLYEALMLERWARIVFRILDRRPPEPEPVPEPDPEEAD